ncbi:hypothetical protein SAMN02927930_01190 [Pseudidiomarina indica]|uniref:Uncharacterized protein n=1 Tax=Pseudidiomarina indica TaxID=1159017 RepID=A0A1G6CBY7_9GAMM|nr:hypothetical protein SAMN02927930_01190 [Pseudidiomarina indica]
MTLKGYHKLRDKGLNTVFLLCYSVTLNQQSISLELECHGTATHI